MACSDPETAKFIALFELGLLSPEEKRRFEVHLIACDECFRSLYEMDPVAGLLRQGQGAPQEKVDLSTEETREAHWTPDRGSRPLSRGRRTWALVFGGAAAVAVMAIFALRPTEPEREAGRLRGPRQGTILAFTPSGDVSPPAELAWKLVPGARAYEVSIHSAGGDSVWNDVVRGPPASLPDPVREALGVGQTYYWQVEALTAEERLGPTRFTIRER